MMTYNESKKFIKNNCCFELKNVGKNLPEFVIMQNIRWLDISENKPVSNIFNILNIKYNYDEKGLHYISEKGEKIKIVSINNNSPYLELSLCKEKYVIYGLNNNRKHLFTIVRPKFNSFQRENYISYNHKFTYIKLADNSEFNVDYIKCENLILDMRDNSGGKISDLQRITSYFAGNNVLIDTIYNNYDSYIIKTKGNKKIKFKNLYILINANTASAAEILCKFLLENFNCTTIGENSKGKLLLTSIHNINEYLIKIPRFKINNYESYKNGIKPDKKIDYLLNEDIFPNSFLKIKF